MNSNPIYSWAKARQFPPSVGILELTDPELTDVPKELSEMVNLSRMVLKGHGIADIARLLAVLGTLPKLEYLQLDLGVCDKLPPEIGTLKNVELLHLIGKNLHLLPDEIRGMDKLKQVELEIDNWVGDEPHLQVLGGVPTLRSVGFRGGGNPARGLEHLKQVTAMSAFRITQLPIGLGGMTALKQMLLGILPSDPKHDIHLEELNQLPNLERIWITSKASLHFPASMAGMRALETLEIEDSQLPALPAGLWDAPAIKVIKAIKSWITELPEWIGNLKTLEELHLTENRIQQLPSTLPGASCLKKLWLDENQFAEFPAVIVQSPSLEMVWLGQNKVEAVPALENVASNLKYLSLRTNKLAECPWALVDLPGLWLGLEGNPFVKAAGYNISDVIGAVTREPHPVATRRTLVALALGDIQRALQSATLEELLLGLNHAAPKLRAFAMDALHQFLPDPFSIDQPPTSILIAGNSKAHDLKKYQQQLQEKHIQVNKGKPGEVDVVVVDEQPGDEVIAYIQAGAKPATITQLVAFLDQLDKPWLRKKADEQPKVAENLFQLLASGTPENLTLAFQMMEKGGVPNSLVSPLLAIQLIHPDPTVRKLAEKHVDPVVPTALKSFLIANKRNVSAMNRKKLLAHFQDIAQHPEIDPHGFCRMGYLLDKDLAPVFAPHVKPEDLPGFVNGDGYLSLPIDKPTAIPQGVLDAERVDSLNLVAKNLTAPPTGIGKIKGLRRLDLSYNSIATLPDEMGMLKELELLNLYGNGMKAVPPQVLDLPGLQKLDLGSNPIGSLPDQLSRLTALRELSIGNHSIRSFPAVLEKMPWLEVLDLTARTEKLGWGEFPMALLKFTHLRELRLGGHPITALPEALKTLPLERLGLESCKLKELPQWLTTVKSLQHLEVNRIPELSQLPETIGELVDLKVLNIGYTGIRSLPASFARLQRLEQLNISCLGFEDKDALVALLNQLPALKKIVYELPPDVGFKQELARLLPHVKIA